MLFDANIMASVAREVEETLTGARVSGVRQPHFAQVYVDFGGRGTLCACSAPDAARVHLATRVPEGPAKPLAFCSALRRHLVGARLVEAKQVDFDRVLWLRFAEAEGHGAECRRALIVEVMGRHSNIILVDDADSEAPPHILACAKHVTHRVNRYREILPDEPYVPPPASDRVDPRSVTREDVRRIFEASPGPAGKALAKSLAGASPIFVAEALHRSGLGADEPGERLSADDIAQIVSALRELTSGTGAFVHVPLVPGDKFVPYPVQLQQLASTHRAEPRDSISAALEEVALGAQRAAALAQLRATLDAAIGAALGRAQSKLSSRRDQLASAGDHEAHRRIGEAIIANIPRIPDGADHATLVDYADPDQRSIEVELDPDMSPAENAQKHFDAYRRGKRIAARLPRLIAEAERDVACLTDARARLESLDDIDDLRELRDELQSRGYVSAPKRKAQRRERASAATTVHVPRIESHGCTILYGRNEAQNEHLLRRLASPNDLWLHVRGAPSGHVIIKCPGRGEAPREVIVQAARIAARNSATRGDDAVEVDYTLRKHVTKPKGSRPGFVRYTHAKTIVVKP